MFRKPDIPFWQIVVVVMFCLFSSTDLMAIDINMRRLASEATVAQTTAMLSRKIIQYEQKKADLLRQIIVREETGQRKINFLQSHINTVSLALPSVAGHALRELSREWLDRHMDRNFRQILMETHRADENLYKQILNSSPNSADRAQSISRAIDASSIYSEIIRDVANEEQRLHFAEYKVDQIQHLLGRNFQEDATFREGLEKGMPRFDAGAERQQVLALGQHMKERNANGEKLVTETRDLQEKVKSQIEQTRDALETLSSTVASTQSEIARLGRSAVQQDTVPTEQGAILLDDLESDIINLDIAYNQLSDDVQFNQSLLFGTLPSSEKIKVLKNPRFLNERFPNEKERQKAIERLEVQETAQSVLTAARGIQDASRGICDILLQTDVIDPEEAKDVQEIISAAGSLVSVGVGIYTGDVLGVLTGISGLLGGGGSSGPDPQVMAALSEISAMLDEVSKKILKGQQKILKGQQKILEGQKEILEGLEQFERRMIEQLGGLDHSITQVQRGLTGIRDMLRSYSDLGVKLTDCRIFSHRRSGSQYGFISDGDITYIPAIVQFATGTFPTWDALRQHYRDNRDQWKRCIVGIEQLFASGREIHTSFLMSTYTSDSGRGLITDYIEPGFKPLARLMTRHYPSDVRTFCVLLNSPLTYDEIDYRGYTLFAADIDNYCRLEANGISMDPVMALNLSTDREPPSLNSGPWLIHPDALVYFAYLLMEVLPYRSIITRTGDGLLEPDVAAFQEPIEDVDVISKELVETAYRLVNIAIAQQVLMTGDIFLPLIHRYLFSSFTTSSDREDVINILKHNKQIAKNYFIMQFRRELQLRTRQGRDADRFGTVFAENMRLYEIIFQCRNRQRNDCSEHGYLGYERLFATYWEFSTDDNEVILSLGKDSDAGKTAFSLPTPQDIASGFYHVTWEYQELVRLRGKIIDYAFRNELQLFTGRESFVRDGYFVWY